MSILYLLIGGTIRGTTLILTRKQKTSVRSSSHVLTAIRSSRLREDSVVSTCVIISPTYRSKPKNGSTPLRSLIRYGRRPPILSRSNQVDHLRWRSIDRSYKSRPGASLIRILIATAGGAINTWHWLIDQFCSQVCPTWACIKMMW